MHTIKLKQVFTILLIFLFCFYGIWLSRGEAEAENASIVKDFGQVPVNNKKEIQSFDSGAKYHQTIIKKEDPFPFEIAEEKGVSKEWSGDEGHQSNVLENDAYHDLPEPFPASAQEKKTLSGFGIDNNEISSEKSPLSEDKQGVDTDKDVQSDGKEKDISPTASALEIESFLGEESGIELPALDEKPHPDIVEEKILSSDIVDGKGLRENPSIKEDGQKIADDKEASSAASPITPSALPPDEEEASLEEKREDRASAVDSKQQGNLFDEKKSSSLEEDGMQTSKDSGEQLGINPDDESISLLQEPARLHHSDGEKSPIDFESISIEKTDPQEPEREITMSEIQSLPVEQSGISLTTLDDRPSLDIVEDKPPSSDTVDEKNLQENPSVNEDDENFVAEKETSSDTSPITPPNEEVSSIEEEREDHASVVDSKQQGNSFNEEKSSSPEEDKLSISHLVNPDEEEPPDIEEEDISSHLSESFPVTVHEEKTLSEFGIDDNEISGGTSPGSEDKQGVVTDKDLLSGVKEKETLPITSKINESPDHSEVDISMPLSKGAQAAGGEVDTQGKVGEETESDEVKSTWEIWHSDPTHSIILAVVITLIAAKLGGWIAGALGFPGVVGKLILGMILGNIYLLTGFDYFDFLKTMPFLKMLSYFGTLVLLLTAGLHTDLRAILRVGPSSVLVCLGGMVVPAGLGLIVSHFLLPDSSTGSKILLSIVLCSTSTGLLFAILNELKIMNTIEGRVITGATILTEIIVILSFGIASGIVVKGGVSLLGISVSFGIAFFLLITAVIIIFKYGERFGNFLTNRLTDGLNIPIIVILSLLMAFMFGSIGLHTVIGAFIAGLFLRNVKLRNSDDNEHRNVESFIRPFYALLVPILFLRVGAQVDLQNFLNLDAILLGINITGAAILGKLFCGFCPIEKGTNRLLVGFGMAMKLEGTLILAGIGSDLGIFNDTVFSSIIMSIVFTSTICPFLMKMFLLKKNNTSYESICIDPEKTELAKVRANKRMRLKIFGLYLI